MHLKIRSIAAIFLSVALAGQALATEMTFTLDQSNTQNTPITQSSSYRLRTCYSTTKKDHLRQTLASVQPSNAPKTVTLSANSGEIRLEQGPNTSDWTTSLLVKITRANRSGQNPTLSVFKGNASINMGTVQFQQNRRTCFARIDLPQNQAFTFDKLTAAFSDSTQIQRLELTALMFPTNATGNAGIYTNSMGKITRQAPALSVSFLPNTAPTSANLLTGTSTLDPASNLLSAGASTAFASTMPATVLVSTPEPSHYAFGLGLIAALALAYQRRKRL